MIDVRMDEGREVAHGVFETKLLMMLGSSMLRLIEP